MAASNSSNVPQGFSVYQPTLGAQLQFFPNMGTQELDQLIHAFLPGTASIQEKRASVALDFFEHIQLTGESFKFYPVYSMTTPVESPVNASPVQESGYASCFNASPVMSNWDWSEISSSTSQASNSRQRRQSSKAPVSRHQTADFSHLPGMKIMTKDGRDVTNSASRGSKTKEQRDHAHLMRIIKACDSCRKKKIRCDPSHKKRSVAQAQAQSVQKNAKKSKTKATAKQIATPVVVETDFSASFTSFDVSASFATAENSSVSPAATTFQSWEDLIQYPADTITEDYDFFHDPEGLFSSPESLTMSSSSKPDTPVSEQYQPLAVGINPQPQPESRLPYNQSESVHDYVDFNLYSPASSCSSLPTSSPKPSIPEHREENPGGVQQHTSGFDLWTSSNQVQETISFIGGGLSSAENISTLTDSPMNAAMATSRQDYYAIADMHLDDYSVGIDANHNLAQSQHRDGDQQSTDHSFADPGEMSRHVLPSSVIATSVIATDVIDSGVIATGVIATDVIDSGVIATEIIANRVAATSAASVNVSQDVNDNVHDEQSSQVGLAASGLEQQESSGVDMRQDYSELNIVDTRRTRISSAYVDDGAVIANTTTPAIETLSAHVAAATAIATSAQESLSTQDASLETPQTTGASIETYATTSDTAAISTGERIYLSSTDAASSLAYSSVYMASILVQGYLSASQSAEKWLLAIMSVMLLSVLFCRPQGVMNTVGQCQQQLEQTFGCKDSKVNPVRSSSAYASGRWEALRCHASAVTRSLGRAISLTGRSLAL